MAAWTTIDAARDGNPKPLADRLRDLTSDLTTDERRYLADVIERRVPIGPPHRPARKATEAARLKVGATVIALIAAGWPRKKAFEEAAKLDPASTGKARSDRS